MLLRESLSERRAGKTVSKGWGRGDAEEPSPPELTDLYFGTDLPHILKALFHTAKGSPVLSKRIDNPVEGIAMTMFQCQMITGIY